MADKWCESYGQDAGRPLEFKIFKYIMRIIGSSSQQQLAMEKDEPVCKVLATAPARYWVCGYANNQHAVEEDITSNPRSTSFYRAMQVCRGVLLVLDSAGTPFQRTWCCFEESIAIEHREDHWSRRRLLLDVGATAHVLTDGLAGSETRMIGIVALHRKSIRERGFPLDLLE
ncbi:unnamed protein product [Durusdinium trenchii]|uniref:Uncharacterized protein n=1 Tax=Durusdinium trenchii TaxID=1381693 RepID=A0ABP0S1V0_9DINO